MYFFCLWSRAASAINMQAAHSTHLLTINKSTNYNGSNWLFRFTTRKNLHYFLFKLISLQAGVQWQLLIVSNSLTTFVSFSSSSSVFPEFSLFSWISPCAHQSILNFFRFPVKPTKRITRKICRCDGEIEYQLFVPDSLKHIPVWEMNNQKTMCRIEILFVYVSFVTFINRRLKDR